MPAPNVVVSAADLPLFTTWKEGDVQSQQEALAAYGSGLARGSDDRAPDPLVRRARATDVYRDQLPGTHIRDEVSREDYDAYRPGEAIPTKPKEIIAACMEAYHRCGIVRNVIDLMGDFATQGIDLNHPNERIEKFYKEWFRRVGGKERSERFLHMLYRCGQVVIQRRTAKLTVEQADKLKKAQATQGRAQATQGEPDVEYQEEVQTTKRELPWSYLFRSPLSVDVVAEELALFLGRDELRFSLRLPPKLIQKIKSPKDATERELVAKLPQDLVTQVRKGARSYPLDPQKVKGYHYKRDDWEVWARPMVYSILGDLSLLEKMKLADRAALDGAISSIRVWKLGNIENRIYPTAQAMNRLADMLMNNVGGGVMDLIWGPELELVETSTEVHRFLGSQKYEPVLTAIYAGLGIPPTLTGAKTDGGGFTNNFISLKTLTERLQYGRDVLRSFWEQEIRLVQKAMGFRFPASLVFDRMVLSDEAAEKQLLINLADRDLISMETLQERFGETPEVESLRIRREHRKRQNGQLPGKASPFHTAEKEHELKKMFVQSGSVTPGQVGLELEEKKKGENTPAEHNAKVVPKPAPVGGKPKGQPGQGRPKNKKDSGPRKQKRVLPRSKATAFFELAAWAGEAGEKIATLTSPAYLQACGKKNFRQLSRGEAEAYEQFRFQALCTLSPGEEVSGERVERLLSQPLSVPAFVSDLVRATIAGYVEKHGREPSLETVRQFQCQALALWHAGDAEDGEGEDE